MNTQKTRISNHMYVLKWKKSIFLMNGFFFNLCLWFAYSGWVLFSVLVKTFALCETPFIFNMSMVYMKNPSFFEGAFWNFTWLAMWTETCSPIPIVDQVGCGGWVCQIKRPIQEDRYTRTYQCDALSLNELAIINLLTW